MGQQIDKGGIVSFYGSTLVADVHRTENLDRVQYGTIKQDGVWYRVARHAIAIDWQVVGRISR